jgi:RNA polymerase sigma factor (sigma-70 family)
MSSDAAPAPAARSTLTHLQRRGGPLSDPEGDVAAENEAPMDHDGLAALIAAMVRRRNAELWRLRRRAMERDAEYLRERMESIHTWMDPEAQWIERECQALYDKTLASLSPACQAVFVAVREEGHSYAEVAQSLGISVKMVAKHMTNAHRVYRAALTDYGIVPPPERKKTRGRIGFVPSRSNLSESDSHSESLLADTRLGALC